MFNRRNSLLIIFISLTIVFKIYPQSEINISKQSGIYLSACIGYKYHFTRVEPFVYESNEVYKNYKAISLSIACDFYDTDRHIFGVEFIGFPYIYGKHPMSPRYFTITTSVFYRRNIFLYDNILVYPGSSITLFSNDSAHLFALALEFGVSYKFKNH